MVYVFLADGFEIIEALAPVDMLQRAKLEVKTVGVTGKTVKSSGGIEVTADIEPDEICLEKMQMMILPGGMPGTLNLEASQAVQSCIDYSVEHGIYIAAICAAPTILAHKGLLDGKEATVFPSFAADLEKSEYIPGGVHQSGKYITAAGAGVCIEFGLKCVENLTDAAQAAQIKAAIQS